GAAGFARATVFGALTPVRFFLKISATTRRGNPVLSWNVSIDASESVSLPARARHWRQFARRQHVDWASGAVLGPPERAVTRLRAWQSILLPRLQELMGQQDERGLTSEHELPERAPWHLRVWLLPRLCAPSSGPSYHGASPASP